ncbi:E1 ubiquitin-activating protein uba2 [Teratosphaeriaceae sp. CCFEE 6253]|nr:E1 ubiquitin-activating protein uba2 [Teratosphaeriaceae sp. CCFEE 6253]
MQRRDRGLAQSLGLPLTKRVKESRVLLVGAGGIGCELLKNLVCCGFGSLPTSTTTNGSGSASTRQPEIVVVDLDTIDLSNLNRQFLFRKQHIKKPKAHVAKQTASAFNPSVNITAHHASIFDPPYDVPFFASFDLVFNALDNLAARRHVNRMCLAADVPLIESGTTGFNGQVQVIWAKKTECYDCNPKPVQKSFPICTIRSTPSQAIHCIVWAKSYLLPELFGTSEEESTEVEVTEGDNAEEVAKLREEAEALKGVRKLMGKSEFAQAIFDKVFHDDIERLRSMTEMWQSRRPPESLRFDTLWTELDGDILAYGQSCASLDQAPWSVRESLAVFAHATSLLTARSLSGGESVIEFDKDDKDTLDFVSATANLRAHVFGIPAQSEWDTKQMAGNIIPAIATSNALTASLCVMQGFKILRSLLPGSGDGRGGSAAMTGAQTNGHGNGHGSSGGGKETPALGGAKMVFLNSRSTERLLTTQNLAPPNPHCPVCSPTYATLVVPATGEQTLQDLVNLLKSQVGYEDLGIATEAGIIYDPDLEDNLEKALSEYVAQGKGFVTVTDGGGDWVDLVLSVTLSSETTDAGLRLMPESIVLPNKAPKELALSEVDGEVMVNGNGKVGTPVPVQAPAGGKRKRSAPEDEDGAVGSAKKRAKAAVQAVYEVVDDDGAILLDDD